MTADQKYRLGSILAIVAIGIGGAIVVGKMINLF